MKLEVIFYYAFEILVVILLLARPYMFSPKGTFQKVS